MVLVPDLPQREHPLRRQDGQVAADPVGRGESEMPLLQQPDAPDEVARRAGRAEGCKQGITLSYTEKRVCAWGSSGMNVGQGLRTSVRDAAGP
jgi:hypothetical protein